MTVDVENQQYKVSASNFERFTSEKSIQFCLDKNFSIYRNLYDFGSKNNIKMQSKNFRAL